MIQYRRHGYQEEDSAGIVDYLFGVPVCEQAMKWVRENLSILPVDDQSLTALADIGIEVKKPRIIEVEILEDTQKSSEHLLRVLSRK